MSGKLHFCLCLLNFLDLILMNECVSMLIELHNQRALHRGDKSKDTVVVASANKKPLNTESKDYNRLLRKEASKTTRDP